MGWRVMGAGMQTESGWQWTNAAKVLASTYVSAVATLAGVPTMEDWESWN